MGFGAAVWAPPFFFFFSTAVDLTTVCYCADWWNAPRGTVLIGGMHHVVLCWLVECTTWYCADWWNAQWLRAIPAFKWTELALIAADISRHRWLAAPLPSLSRTGDRDKQSESGSEEAWREFSWRGWWVISAIFITPVSTVMGNVSDIYYTRLYCHG